MELSFEEDSHIKSFFKTFNLYDLYVKDLLLQALKGWDILKVHSLFSEPVTASLIKTPLLEEVKEDKLVWKFESHGTSTVKSGYKRYIKNKSMEQSYMVDRNWNSLRHICAPPETKHLLWRICRGCLPSRCRLKLRHVPCPSECPLCLNEEEDEWHIFFGCSETRHVWYEAGLQQIIEPRLRYFNNVHSLFFDICSRESVSDAGTVAMVVWSIWHNRNNWVWNGMKDSAKDVALRAMHMIGEWRAVNMLHHHNGSSVFVPPQLCNYVAAGSSSQSNLRGSDMLQWQRPSSGWWKCNVDTSLAQNSNYTVTL